MHIYTSFEDDFEPRIINDKKKNDIFMNIHWGKLYGIKKWHAMYYKWDSFCKKDCNYHLQNQLFLVQVSDDNLTY